MVHVIIAFIRSYQKIGSMILLPHSCRFYPTCSHYAISALEKYGLFKGSGMIFFRLLRCSPLSKGGYDPIK